MAGYDLSLFEREHVIGRLKGIEILERITRYRSLLDPVERRFSGSLKTLPPVFHSAALLLYSTIVYLPKPMLDETWPCIWRAAQHSQSMPHNRNEIAFLELDRDQIRDDFYRTNGFPGRLEDNTLIRSGQDLVDALMSVEFGATNAALAEQFSFMRKRNYWLLLADVTLSGISIVSEMQRLSFLLNVIFPSSGIAVSCISQVATKDACEFIAKANFSFQSSIIIPSSYAFASPDFQLLATQQARKQVDDLCEWFAETHVRTSREERITKLSIEQNDPGISKYGFGSRGWTIVTHKNTPNNSLPMIWFRPPKGLYTPPFERLDSRLGSSSPHRREWISALEKDDGRQEDLRKKLESAMK